MKRQRIHDQRELALEQERQYERQYRLQQIAVFIVPWLTVLLALISAILSWLPTQWLIVIVAFCLAGTQGIQAFIQMKLYPPKRTLIAETLHTLREKQKKAKETEGSAPEPE